MAETNRSKLPELTGDNFAVNLLSDIAMTRLNMIGSGEENPFQTIAYYVIELESRIAELENRAAQKINGLD